MESVYRPVMLQGILFDEKKIKLQNSKHCFITYVSKHIKSLYNTCVKAEKV